jgi:Lrp/AsnC family transcriptional regulator
LAILGGFGWNFIRVFSRFWRVSWNYFPDYWHVIEFLSMDTLDQKILNLLQEDATLSVAEIGERVGLSTTPCWRRIQNLEKAGIIQGRVTLLDAEKLNVGVTVFVAIRTNQHSLEWLEKFADAVSKLPEVVEFYRMSGDVDYLLRVVVPDIAGYDAVYKRLIAAVELSDVSSSFAMEKIKSTTALPLGYVKLD